VALCQLRRRYIPRGASNIVLAATNCISSSKLVRWSCVAAMVCSIQACAPFMIISTWQGRGILLQGQVGNVSQYNPLDLFSPDPAGQRRALAALLRSPQNNLCVHIHGTRTSPRSPVAADLDLHDCWPELHAALQVVCPVAPDVVPAEYFISLIVVRARWPSRNISAPLQCHMPVRYMSTAQTI
jgi:Inositol-pentakisphosphate 2-kinase